MCQKCGAFTMWPKHLRSKITRERCLFERLPRDQWMTTPGRFGHRAYLQQEYDKMQKDRNPNRHHYYWNACLGRVPTRDDYGYIWCGKCKKQWPWERRHRVSKVLCNARYAVRRVLNADQRDAATEPPAWVLQRSHFCPDGYVHVVTPPENVQQPSAEDANGAGMDPHPRIGVG